jgi:hypothetical protein
MAKKKVGATKSSKAAKKSTAKKAPVKKAKKKGAAKRELISPIGDARYVRRDAEGQFKESDDVGRSQKADRATQAKRIAKSGQGDKGDRKKK